MHYGIPVIGLIIGLETMYIAVGTYFMLTKSVQKTLEKGEIHGMDIHVGIMTIIALFRIFIPIPFLFFNTRCMPDNYKNRHRLVKMSVYVNLNQIVLLIYLPLAIYVIKLIPPELLNTQKVTVLFNGVSFFMYLYFNGIINRYAKKKLKEELET